MLQTKHAKLPNAATKAIAAAPAAVKQKVNAAAPAAVKQKANAVEPAVVIKATAMDMVTATTANDNI